MQQERHLYCFAILGLISTVIHSINQCLLRNLAWKYTAACVFRDFLGERLQRAVTQANYLHWTDQYSREDLLQELLCTPLSDTQDGMQRLTLQVHDGDGVEVLEALQKGSLQLHRSAHDGCSKHVRALQELQEDGNKLLRMDWGKNLPSWTDQTSKTSVFSCLFICCCFGG